MADAKKCDRCGGYYDVAIKDDEIIRIRTLNRMGNSIKGYDVCPKCVKSFTNWIEEGRIVEA